MCTLFCSLSWLLVKRIDLLAFAHLSGRVWTRHMGGKAARSDSGKPSEVPAIEELLVVREGARCVSRFQKSLPCWNHSK